MGTIRCLVAASVIFVLAAAPSGFYSVPSPLPRAAPGTVIWARPLTAGSALTSAGANTLVLYHTVSADGRDVAVSGVIAIPKGPAPPGGWPVISWAHGTTGNAPQCAPSTFAKPDSEQRFLDRWVSAGFAVVQTDYEGEGTPGIHPYFSGVSGAHDVTDIVRAARHLYPGIGDRWIAMGHSEGGTVAMFAAATANSWAPELHLLGAVAYAPGSDIPDFFGQMTVSRQPTPMLPLLGMDRGNRVDRSAGGSQTSFIAERLGADAVAAISVRRHVDGIGRLDHAPARRVLSSGCNIQPLDAGFHRERSIETRVSCARPDRARNERHLRSTGELRDAALDVVRQRIARRFRRRARRHARLRLAAQLRSRSQLDCRSAKRQAPFAAVPHVTQRSSA